LPPLPVFSNSSDSDRMRMVIAYPDRGRLGRDLGSDWSPKPISEVRSLGRPRRSGPLSLGYPSVKRPQRRKLAHHVIDLRAGRAGPKQAS